MPDQSNGAALIAAERQRQVDAEGWTPEHDDEHTSGEMRLAASAYLITSPAPEHAPGYWPWERSWWKPSGDPVRDLVKAGALIAAEIDRIERSR